MSDAEDTEVAATAGPPEIDTMDHEQAIAYLRGRQRFGLAVAAGLGSALVGAVLWAVIVYVTEYQLGLVAIAVGALVGIAVREAGQGVDQKFGILGAACAALGWLLGTIMVDVALLAKAYDVGFFDALGRLGASDIIELLKTTSDAMDLLFLAIAVYEGYRFAFRYKIG